MNPSRISLIVLLWTGACIAAPAPQPFTSGWGDPIDPDGDCKIRRIQGALVVEMPGSDHDYDPRRNRFNSPQLFRTHEIDGDFVMEVRVRIYSRPSLKSTVDGRPSLIAAGFLMLLPEDPRRSRQQHRWELRTTRKENDLANFIDYTGWLHRKTQEGTIIVKNEYSEANILNRETYLRVERQRNILYFTFSSDEKTWKESIKFLGLGVRDKLKVGLAAYSSSTEPSKVQFDQLIHVRGKKKER